MPLYEYKCKECGRIVEVIQKFSDLPLKKCSFCYGKLYKLISNSTFHLKGGGWYVTDYGSDAAKANSSKNVSSNGTSSNDNEIKGNNKKSVVVS